MRSLRYSINVTLDGCCDHRAMLFTGGVTLPQALTELGLIDEYELVVHPRLAGHGPALFAGLSKHVGDAR
jgi:riboflavin biosynthesis pyrimidine reductase